MINTFCNLAESKLCSLFLCLCSCACRVEGKALWIYLEEIQSKESEWRLGFKLPKIFFKDFEPGPFKFAAPGSATRANDTRILKMLKFQVEADGWQMPPKNFRLLSFHSGGKSWCWKLADRYFAILNSKLKKEGERETWVEFEGLRGEVGKRESMAFKVWHSLARARLNNNQELNSTPLLPFLNY